VDTGEPLIESAWPVKVFGHTRALTGWTLGARGRGAWLPGTRRSRDVRNPKNFPGTVPGGGGIGVRSGGLVPGGTLSSPPPKNCPVRKGFAAMPWKGGPLEAGDGACSWGHRGARCVSRGFRLPGRGGGARRNAVDNGWTRKRPVGLGEFPCGLFQKLALQVIQGQCPAEVRRDVVAAGGPAQTEVREPQVGVAQAGRAQHPSQHPALLVLLYVHRATPQRPTAIARVRQWFRAGGRREAIASGEAPAGEFAERDEESPQGVSDRGGTGAAGDEGGARGRDGSAALVSAAMSA
jgi:hypothetical protein